MEKRDKLLFSDAALMRVIDVQTMNQQQMERNCRKATRVTAWNRSHFNLKRYKKAIGEKTNVLVSKKLAVRFVISRGVGG